MIKTILFLFTFISISLANPLQDAIDNAPAYATLKLPAGIYSGNIIINKPLTIMGKEPNVIIKGENSARVITINSSYVKLNNLTITDSGNQMITLDSAIQIKKANYCEVSNCKLLNSLYGIDLMMANHTLISNNYITSKKNDIEFRGDAIKIWYSNNNIIKNNTIDSVRDTTLTYSNHNLIKNNTFTNNRFALHLSMSHNNILEENSLKYNSVGIMLMMAKDTKIVKNSVFSSTGAASMGILLKNTENILLKNNSIKYNAVGIYIDTKHTQAGMQRKILNNTIAYNKEALNFHAAIKNNTIVGNNIYANIDDVVKSARSDVTYLNIIEKNYWDMYSGFDKNKDNIGDTSHKIYQYADQLWHYDHKVKFFYASPLFSLLNFLANLAPFVEPVLILEDKKPLVEPLHLLL